MLTQGGELFERVAERGGLPEQEVTGYFWQILDAVAHCHSQSVCHRDRECATAFLMWRLSIARAYQSLSRLFGVGGLHGVHMLPHCLYRMG